MRYWVFQNFRVTGPFEVDALGRIAGFSPTTLVCPDLNSGMDAESWTRAGTVPELAAALYPALRRAAAKPRVPVPEPPAPPPSLPRPRRPPRTAEKPPPAPAPPAAPQERAGVPAPPFRIRSLHCV